METSLRPVIFMCIAAFAAAGSTLHAEEPAAVGFDRIWELVKTNSHAISAASSDASAAGIAGDRLSRHWLPRIYADARAYASNDPGAAFMSNLGQRSVTSSDFEPHTLNRPGTDFHRKGTIGADLPVYEGGAPTAIASAAKTSAKAKQETRASIYLAEFTDAASAYGKIIVLKKTAAELADVKTNVSSILDNYQTGLSSNPVEYSGILGLKALRNRITALIADTSSSIAAYTDYLNSSTGTALSPDWVPADTDAPRFADIILSPHASGRESHAVRALGLEAERARSLADGAASVFLPTVSLFSEADIYSGKRDTSNSWSAGFYVRMNLVSPMDYGTVGQARHESEAASEHAKDAQRREQIELRSLVRSSETLVVNIATLRASAEIMNEQLKTARKLFSSGTVKSFQLADVFSKKTDLIVNLSQAEEQYLMTKTRIYTITGDAEGIRHE